MGKPIVVENVKVDGTDKHNVTGQATNPAPPPPPTVPYAGVGDFDYVGKMTDQLSDFVSIDGKPVALKSSKSSLNPERVRHLRGDIQVQWATNFMPPLTVRPRQYQRPYRFQIRLEKDTAQCHSRKLFCQSSMACRHILHGWRSRLTRATALASP